MLKLLRRSYWEEQGLTLKLQLELIQAVAKGNQRVNLLLTTLIEGAEEEFINFKEFFNIKSI